MTIKMLKEYRIIAMEIPDLEKRIEKTKEQLRKIENQGSVSDTVSGGMGGIQHFSITGFPTRDYTKVKNRLLSQQMSYQKSVDEFNAIVDEVNDYIENIEDACTRMIFRYYYLDGLSQEMISEKIHLDQSVISRKINTELGVLKKFA